MKVLKITTEIAVKKIMQSKQEYISLILVKNDTTVVSRDIQDNIITTYFIIFVKFKLVHDHCTRGWHMHMLTPSHPTHTYTNSILFNQNA